MVPVGSPVAIVGADGDDRFGEAIELLHHLDHAFEVGGREIALVGCRLDLAQRQQREHVPVAADRLLERRERIAAVGLDRGGQILDRLGRLA